MVKENDFIELSYTGKNLDTGKIFDTTDHTIALKESIFSPNRRYGNVSVCLGQNLLVSGFEEDILNNSKIGEEKKVELEPEQAFGKKDSKNLKLVQAKVFKEKKINPVPGLQVDIDGKIATIKTVTGGRCIVDFNHPLSGHKIEYTYKLEKVIEDDIKKVETIFELMFGVPIKASKVEKGVEVELPATVGDELVNIIKDKVKEIANVDLIVKSAKK